MPKNVQATTQLNLLHMLLNTKILQVRLQAYVNQELPDIQIDLEKAEELEVKHLLDHGKSKRIKKERKNKKTYFFTDYAIAFDCVH